MILCLFLMVAVLARIAGPLPVRRPTPGAHLAAAYLADYSWRADILRRQHDARTLATYRQAYTYAGLYNRNPGHPADPQSFWPAAIGRPPLVVSAA